MEETAKTALEIYQPYVVLMNLVLVAIILAVVSWILGRAVKTDGVPGRRQNAAEFMTQFFYNKAREMDPDPRIVRIVAPFLATCFMLILVSNLFLLFPFPLLKTPPTAYFSVTLGLALCAVAGTFVISTVVRGPQHSFKHLFWPNPLQLISEVTDVLSLSLRLFGNIGGEYMTVALVTAAVAVGIPFILHVLGLIPAFVQALVFTLLTTSFIASAIHTAHEKAHATEEESEPTLTSEGGAPVVESALRALEGEDEIAPEKAEGQEQEPGGRPQPIPVGGLAARGAG